MDFTFNAKNGEKKKKLKHVKKENDCVDWIFEEVIFYGII